MSALEVLLGKLSTELSHAPKERRLLLASVVYFLVFLLVCSVAVVIYVIVLIFSGRDFAIDDIVSRQHGKLVFWEAADSIPPPTPITLDDFADAVGAATNSAFRFTELSELKACKDEVQQILSTLDYSPINDALEASVFGYRITSDRKIVRATGRCVLIGRAYAIFFLTLSPDRAAADAAVTRIYQHYDRVHTGTDQNINDQRIIGQWRDIASWWGFRMATFNTVAECKTTMASLLEYIDAGVTSTTERAVFFDYERTKGWIDCIGLARNLYAVPFTAIGFDSSAAEAARNHLRGEIDKMIVKESRQAFMGGSADISTSSDSRLVNSSNFSECISRYYSPIEGAGGSITIEEPYYIGFKYKTSIGWAYCYFIDNGIYLMHYEAHGFKDEDAAQVRDLISNAIDDAADEVGPSSVSLSTDRVVIAALSTSDCLQKVRTALEDNIYELAPSTGAQLIGRQGRTGVIMCNCLPTAGSDGFEVTIAAAGYDSGDGALWQVRQLVETLLPN